MKTLQIILFLIANIVFISQASRDLHLLVFGTEGSVLDKYEREKVKARAERQFKVLLFEFEAANETVEKLEEGEKGQKLSELRQSNSKLYETRDALRSEISEREEKNRELRDTLLFAGFGFLLIVLGGVLYRRASLWPGFALVVTGFCIIEYWASPSFFGGGAAAEFRQLLLCKTILTLVALAALYACWKMRETPGKTEPMVDLAA